MNEIIENFDAIIVNEWLEKANSIVAPWKHFSICSEFLSPFLEDGAHRTAYELDGVLQAFCHQLRSTAVSEFVGWVFTNTHVLVNGKYHALASVIAPGKYLQQSEWESVTVFS